MSVRSEQDRDESAPVSGWGPHQHFQFPYLATRDTRAPADERGFKDGHEARKGQTASIAEPEDEESESEEDDWEMRSQASSISSEKVRAFLIEHGANPEEVDEIRSDAVKACLEHFYRGQAPQNRGRTADDESSHGVKADSEDESSAMGTSGGKAIKRERTESSSSGNSNEYHPSNPATKKSRTVDASHEDHIS